jgi:hypothetical protein
MAVCCWVLEGIGYTPLTFPASLHVPKALRAKEERANQDYVVGWVQGLWDFIHAHENDPDQSAKLAQDFDESKHIRDGRGRFANRDTARRQGLHGRRDEEGRIHRRILQT